MVMRMVNSGAPTVGVKGMVITFDGLLVTVLVQTLTAVEGFSAVARFVVAVA